VPRTPLELLGGAPSVPLPVLVEDRNVPVLEPTLGLAVFGELTDGHGIPGVIRVPPGQVVVPGELVAGAGVVITGAVAGFGVVPGVVLSCASATGAAAIKVAARMVRMMASFERPTALQDAYRG